MQTQAKLEHYDKAIEHYSRAIAMQPNFVTHLIDYGLTLCLNLLYYRVKLMIIINVSWR